MRVGVGFDVHPLVAGRCLVLGGVAIPHELGLAGHSDGDVVLHAVMDALLGAAALGDIGTHFPSSDASLRDVSSLDLLKRVSALQGDRGWRVGNVDATIVAERPKLAPYITTMRERISGALGLGVHQVSVKATTTDGLGLTGRGEGIAAYAVASLEEVAP